MRPIFERQCVGCHRGDKPKGGLSLATDEAFRAGGESGKILVPGKPEESPLIEYVSGNEPEMPKDGEPLSATQIATLRRWIAGGARWTEGVKLVDRRFEGQTWWSLAPLERPPVPGVDSPWVRTPVDAFVLAKLAAEGLSPSPETDRRTLIRRLSFDLVGLPPTSDDVERFIHDVSPGAYERLVERLLASPGYGERWGRHWLDVVHYGDTHGFDKDKVRPNAWPYRDYVIRAFNRDKPYRRFVREQLAGDVLYPATRDGIVATGFIAAGPFDFVGQIEVGEGTMEKRRVRNLDRDDMVSSTMSTFVSLTAGCARCHDHKFDPVAQEDYYAIQAVFAAVDRADRPFEPDPAVARRRADLTGRRDESSAQLAALDAKIAALAGDELAEIDRRIADLDKTTPPPCGPSSAITAGSNRRPTWPNGSKSTSAARPKSPTSSTWGVTTRSTTSGRASDFPSATRSKSRTTPSSKTASPSSWTTPRPTFPTQA